MAVFRVERNKGYTVMSNHHLRNKELSLKAKGLLSQMLSLPEDWDYHARTIARRVENYSGPEVPLRWLYNSVGMDAKDIAWYFEKGYFANLTLDLNKKMICKRMMPRSDLKRG